MTATKTVYAHNEYTNEYGVKIANTVFCKTTHLSSGKVYKTEYVWVEQTGDIVKIRYSFPNKKKMDTAMEKDNFYYNPSKI